MSWWAWIVVVVVAVVVVAAVGWRALAARRSTMLRERFGPEYDRTLKSAGGRRKAEAKLVERQERRKTLQIIPVTAEAKQRYLADWESAQARFLEAPVPAVSAADALVLSVLSDQGYPMLVGSEQRLADASIDHPETVGDYRQAHEVYRRCDQGKASTEDLRQAMQHYRTFLDSLLNNDQPAMRDGEQPGKPAPETDSAASEAHVDQN
jgi:hypothetical protein